MLAPIAANHGVSFTIAIGSVWGDKKKKSKVKSFKNNQIFYY
jgi:hypothetical protein